MSAEDTSKTALVEVEVPEDASNLLDAIYAEALTPKKSAAEGAEVKKDTPTEKQPASKKKERDPKKGMCRVEGCTLKLVSKKKQFFSLFKSYKVGEGEWGNPHHCRNCKIKVCDAHFTKSPSGMKICTKCLADGVDGKPGAMSPASSNEADDSDEEDDEEEAKPAAEKK